MSFSHKVFGYTVTDISYRGDLFLVNVVTTFNIETNEVTLSERVPY